MLDKLDVEMGTVRATGAEGLLESHWSQSLAHRRCDFLFDSHKQRQLSLPGSSDLRGISTTV